MEKTLNKLLEGNWVSAGGIVSQERFNELKQNLRYRRFINEDITQFLSKRKNGLLELFSPTMMKGYVFGNEKIVNLKKRDYEEIGIKIYYFIKKNKKAGFYWEDKNGQTTES